MQYDFILSIVFYICGCFYALFGAYIVAVNAKSKVNRLCNADKPAMVLRELYFKFSKCCR